MSSVGRRTLVAATAYFVALFTLGFVLGTFRVLVFEPRFGALTATLAEVPVMLTAAFLACRWSIRRWQVPDLMPVRTAMMLWFLLLLFLFETLLGAALFSRTAVGQWATLWTSAGSVGLSAQIIAALFPMFLGSVRWGRSAR